MSYNFCSITNTTSYRMMAGGRYHGVERVMTMSDQPELF